MCLGCNATPATATYAGEEGGLDTSSRYPISGVDSGGEGEEGEDFLESAPSSGFDELPRRLALGAGD